jgi:hypothetical protein
LKQTFIKFEIFAPANNLAHQRLSAVYQSAVDFGHGYRTGKNRLQSADALHDGN